MVWSLTRRRLLWRLCMWRGRSQASVVRSWGWAVRISVSSIRRPGWVSTGEHIILHWSPYTSVSGGNPHEPVASLHSTPMSTPRIVQWRCNDLHYVFSFPLFLLTKDMALESLFISTLINQWRAVTFENESKLWLRMFCWRFVDWSSFFVLDFHSTKHSLWRPHWSVLGLGGGSGGGVQWWVGVFTLTDQEIEPGFQYYSEQYFREYDVFYCLVDFTLLMLFWFSDQESYVIAKWQYK